MQRALNIRVYPRSYPRISASILAGVILFFWVVTAHAVIDTYYEDFDGRQDDATIDGVDLWNVDEGTTSNAVTQDSTTQTGSGKALELTGAETTVDVSRPESYGDISPCWIEFIVNPGIGEQARDLPSGKIAAVTFDHTGKIYASDGSSWEDTGETFTAGEWYRVLLKLDFSTHLYDVYISPVAVPEIEFIPDKENLQFIDTSVSSLSQVGFGGVYNIDRRDDTYIDDLVIHFIDRLQIVSAAQTLVKNKPSGPIIVQLQNSLSEPQTAWQDLTLELRSSSDEGEFSMDKESWLAVTQLIIPGNAQSATFYYKDEKTGKPVISVKEYPDSGWERALQEEEVISEVAHFEVSLTTPHIAGEYFNIIITARDEEGDVNESYTGEIEIITNYISPETGTMVIIPETASGFEEGVLELNALYPDCGIIQVIARDIDEPSSSGTSGQVLFIPASFSLTCETPQTVKKPFPLTITAYNLHGEVTPNYQGLAGLKVVPVSPEDISGGALLPITVGMEDFTDGIAIPEIAYDRWGTIKIGVYDEAYPTQTGLSESVEFQPGGLLIEVNPPSEERDFFYVGEDIEISISVVDDSEAPIPNYVGSVEISSTLGLSLPGEYSFTEADEGSRIFIASTDSAGTYVVEAVEIETGLSAQSPQIQVKEVTLEVEDVYVPVGTPAEVTIILRDEDGEIITSENDLTVLIEVEEENPNQTAISSGLYEPIVFKDGKARFVISDTEAEIVIISARSEYKFKIKKGTVTFGRISKKGIMPRMWWERKD